MPTSQARVPTDRSGRYLTQLCQHANAIGSRTSHHIHGAHPRLRHVEQSDTDAILQFDKGRCTAQVEPDALVLYAEAEDDQSLHRIEQLITADLKRFGTRARLEVVWNRS